MSGDDGEAGAIETAHSIKDFVDQHDTTIHAACSRIDRLLEHRSAFGVLEAFATVGKWMDVLLEGWRALKRILCVHPHVQLKPTRSVMVLN